jgi:hypothetical protein
MLILGILLDDKVWLAALLAAALCLFIAGTRRGPH